MPQKSYKNHDSSFKIPANIIAMICYIIPLIYIVISSFIPLPAIVGYLFIFSPFIFYFFERKSEFVRFHAVSSIVLNVALPLIFEFLIVLVSILGLSQSEIIASLISLIYLGIVMIIVAISVYSLIKAYKYQVCNLPIISKFAKFIATEN